VERSNRDTIAALGRVAVETLPPTTPDSLAGSGAQLPVADWLG